jgi:hypothetical protein
MRYPRSNGARPAISAATPGARVDLRWRCGGAGPPIGLDAPAFPRPRVTDRRANPISGIPGASVDGLDFDAGVPARFSLRYSVASSAESSTQAAEASWS